MSYAEPADMLKRFDARPIGELVSDTSARVSSADLLSNENLQAALDDASGEIDAHVLQGGRYTTAQLSALTGNSAAYLKRICCQIAMAKLWERRPWNDADDNVSAEQSQEQARRALDRLKRGEEVFNVETVKEAGTPSVSTPSRVTIQNLNLTVDRCRGHYYPQRLLPGE